jgi:hypothetical protein
MLRIWVEQLALAQQNSTENAVELVAHRSTGPLEAPPLIHRALQESEVTPSDPFDADEFNVRFAADDDASQSPATHPESE